MSLLVNCNTGDIITYCTPCDFQSAIRKSGIPLVALLDADVAVTDITDETEWAALRVAGKIIVLPQGSATLTSPEQSTQDIVKCRPQLVVAETRTLEYRTRLFDNVDYLDFDLEDTLNKYGSSMTLVYADCNDILYYARNWVTTENPGHDGLSVTSYREDEDAIQALIVNITVNTYKAGFKGLPLTPELKSAIFGCDGSSS
jgi:septum formation topological specificity factor MinE